MVRGGGLKALFILIVYLSLLVVKENVPSNIKRWHGHGSMKGVSQVEDNIILMSVILHKASVSPLVLNLGL